MTAQGSKRRVKLAQTCLPSVGGTPRLDDHETGREPAELDGVRIGQHGDRLNRIVWQASLRQTCRRIDEQSRADLHAGLIRSPSLDSHSARDFNHACQEPESRLESSAWGYLLKFFRRH